MLQKNHLAELSKNTKLFYFFCPAINETWKGQKKTERFAYQPAMKTK